MRNKDRIEPTLKEIEEFWKKHPDWRLGQVIANCVRAYDGRTNCDPFFIEDDELVKGLRRLEGKE